VPPRLPGLTKSTGLLRHPFDAAHGVRTSGLVAGRDLHTGHAHSRHATAYYGVAPSVLMQMLIRWQRTNPAAPLSQFSFVDIGAGMGRALLLASALPFRAVRGVELHPTLVRIARRNLTHWRKSSHAVAPVSLTLGDAAELRFPRGPVVCLLFNPFGATVLRRFLQHAATAFAHRPGQLDLLYINNEQEHVLESTRGFQRLFHGKISRSPEDLRADRDILLHQPEGEYAAHRHEDCSIWRYCG
jgi:SAM-dependent methyltransferase